MKQRAFLAELAQTGSWMRACERAALHASTPARWVDRDERFREKLEDARRRGERVLLAQLEDHLDQRAVAGPNDRMSAILLMFRVKRLDPRYRENAGVQVLSTGPVAITMGVEAEAGPLPVGVGGAPPQLATPRSKGIA